MTIMAKYYDRFIPRGRSRARFGIVMLAIAVGMLGQPGLATGLLIGYEVGAVVLANESDE